MKNKKFIIFIVLASLMLNISAVFSQDEGVDLKKNSNGSQLGDYIEQVQNSLSNIWEPDLDLLSGVGSRKSSVNFYINADGYPSDIKITESSGRESIDKNIIEAIKTHAPYQKIPEASMLDRINISYTFLINESTTTLPEDETDLRKKMNEYHKIVSKKVSKNFKPPHFGTNKYGSVRFVILEDGNVKDLEIVESSKSEKFDEKCKEAVLNSQPFPKPPRNNLVIDYSFSKRSPLNGIPIIIPIIIPH